jgi:hypothetical protein
MFMIESHAYYTQVDDDIQVGSREWTLETVTWLLHLKEDCHYYTGKRLWII